MAELYQGDLPRLLGELRSLVDQSTPLTDDHYPSLKELTGERAHIFKIGHSLRHLSASVGDMQKIIESAEHGELLDSELIYRKIASAMFSLLKLTRVTRVGLDVIVLYIEEIAEKENNKK